MARFSLGRDSDDGSGGGGGGEGSGGPSGSRPIPKKQKTTADSTPSQPAPPPPPPPADEQLCRPRSYDGSLYDSEEEGEEEESDYEGEEEPEDSYTGSEEEESGEEEDGDDDLEHRQDEENDEHVGDGPVSITLTDPDVLDCPICLDSLSIPVYQCENGHIACSSCCSKIRNRCPSCSWPIGYNRCRAVEKILESVKVSCPNVKYGCKMLVKYCDKHNHEKSCNYEPCSCPLFDCNYISSTLHLYEHFESRHPGCSKRFLFDFPFTVCFESSQKFIILQENSEGVIFMVNHFGERLASAVNVVCIGAKSAGKEFTYEISVRNGGTTMKLQSVVERIPVWIDIAPVKNYLLVPDHCNTACGQLKLELCIKSPQ